MSEFESTPFYGMLYYSESGGRHVNLQNTDSFDIYICCASLVSQTAAEHGEVFRLITNRKDLVRSAISRLGLPPLELCTVDFRLDVPPNLPFFEAHQKISVLRAFGRGEFGKRAALIDIDVVFMRPISEALPSGLCVYDISDVIQPEYLEFIRRRRPQSTKPRWFGGEFIAGSANDFANLCQAIEAVIPDYFSNIDNIPHIGDESIVSCALNDLEFAGVSLEDVGRLGIVSRWWSARTLHIQNTFRSVEKNGILHLPADKELLAKYAMRGDRSVRFSQFYKRRVVAKLLVRRFASLLDRIRGRHKFYAAKLGELLL